MRAAQKDPLIREATISATLSVHPYTGKGELRFNNTNRLLGNTSCEIHLSKTGCINEAGRCLVMQASIADQLGRLRDIDQEVDPATAGQDIVVVEPYLNFLRALPPPVDRRT